MTTRKLSLALLGGLMFVASLHAASDVALPFTMPVPDGWRTETIPIPLAFAPELPYPDGIEEIRFAPGMFDANSESRWTYSFVWWVGNDTPNGAASLAASLEAYFRGLSASVAKSGGFEVGDAAFSASLQKDEAGTMYGMVETFDAFVSRGQVRLNVRVNVIECAKEGRQAILFALSPADGSHAVWRELDAIRDGFQCTATPTAS